MQRSDRRRLRRCLCEADRRTAAATATRTSRSLPRPGPLARRRLRRASPRGSSQSPLAEARERSDARRQPVTGEPPSATRFDGDSVAVSAGGSGRARRDSVGPQRAAHHSPRWQRHGSAASAPKPITGEPPTATRIDGDFVAVSAGGSGALRRRLRRCLCERGCTSTSWRRLSPPTSPAARGRARGSSATPGRESAPRSPHRQRHPEPAARCLPLSRSAHSD